MTCVSVRTRVSVAYPIVAAFVWALEVVEFTDPAQALGVDA